MAEEGYQGKLSNIFGANVAGYRRLMGYVEHKEELLRKEGFKRIPIYSLAE